MAKHTILCLDDEVDNVEALERLLRKNYRVLKATSGPEALEILKREHVSVIISDQRMPQMTGVEFLRQSIATHPDAIRILLTGYTDVESVIAAINSGQIYRYVTKPWDPNDLSNAVDKAVERYDLGAELKSKNAALEKALDELKALDRTKSEFMLLINHELKTPLTTILSFGDLLAETKLDEDQTRFLSRIKTAAGRLNDLIVDVMEFLSAETGQLKLNRTKIQTRTLFSNQTEIWSGLIQTKKLSIKMDLAEAFVLADEKVLRNVLRRLIHNSIKFAKDGTEVSLRSAITAGKLKIEIKNMADKEIPREKIERILKPFQLDENIMHHSTGTGLGLSISQSLLKAHGSSLQLDAEGTQMNVSFLLELAT